MTGTEETWLGIDHALRRGVRGSLGVSSLATLLSEHRGVRNIKGLPSLTIEQILAWVDEHKASIGDWPGLKSGQVTGTDETWLGIDACLRAGRRSFPGGSSLAQMLADHRSVRNIMDLPTLTIEQILAWADAHKTATGGWPNLKSGQVTGTDETWARIDRSLRASVRGLPGGSSLAQLLAEHRNVRNAMDLSPLTINQILAWADAHKTAKGEWPKKNSGQIEGTDETWVRINDALSLGLRGLPGDTSLPKLLAEHHDVRNMHDLPDLTIKQILSWADAYHAATNEWPKKNSGPIEETDETWARINASLQQGHRGLPDGSSLAKLLDKERGVRNIRALPDLMIPQILLWADEHKATVGKWPTKNAGQIAGTDETWARINDALYMGLRGLPSGSSLAKLLAEHRDVRNIHGLPDLTIKQILAWADMHKSATGDWPNVKSGKVTGTHETWLGIDSSMRAGRRGLPGGSSLAKLLEQWQGGNL